tara:strand:- start:2 stop:232 length:231 start_codon:yes stop_codon:yes gene_type:complete
MKTLTWSDITTLMTKDAGGRWQVNPGSIAEQYINEGIYKEPTRAYPHTHARVLRTPRFSAYIAQNDITLAKSLGIK